MRMLLACLLTAAVFAGGCATQVGESQGRVGFDFSGVDKVAVLDVSGAASEAVKNQIGDYFVLELLKKGYAPVERQQVQELLKEQQFQTTTGITSTEGAVKAGRILNVPAVVLVSIPDNEEEVSLTAKMVSVEDGAILWQATGYGKKNTWMGTVLGAVVGAGAGAAVGNTMGNDGAVIGGVAGGVVGGMAGQALTPQQAEQIQKIVKQMCKQMPPKNSIGK
jgi:hypothetical protein